MENLSTSQGLLRPILNTMALVSRGAISFKGATPESCKVETHTNWQLEECGEWRRVGEEVREAELRGEGKVFRLCSSADAGRTEASRRAANPRRSFQGIIPCNDTLYLCVARHAEFKVAEHSRSESCEADKPFLHRFLSLLPLSSLSFSQHYTKFQGVRRGDAGSPQTWKTN